MTISERLKLITARIDAHIFNKEIAQYIIGMVHELAEAAEEQGANAREV